MRWSKKGWIVLVPYRPPGKITSHLTKHSMGNSSTSLAQPISLFPPPIPAFPPSLSQLGVASIAICFAQSPSDRLSSAHFALCSTHSRSVARSLGAYTAAHLCTIQAHSFSLLLRSPPLDAPDPPALNFSYRLEIVLVEVYLGGYKLNSVA